MSHTIGLALVWIAAAGIIWVGIAYLTRSESMARNFGLHTLPPPSARAWWQLKGIRDVVSGLLAIVGVLAAPHALWILLLVSAITPLGDALVVLGNRGRVGAALGIHGATAALLVVAAVLVH